MAALFGWQGLSLQHPEDWAPVALSGDRKSGYARLASPRSLSLQIRWAPLGRESLSNALDRYLDRLSKDARRGRQKFSREVVEADGRLLYRYRSEHHGDGTLFPMKDGRIAFLEALGDSTSARKRLLEKAHESFQSGEDTDRWSLLGLDFRVPGPLRVESKEFLAGRTSLSLVGHGVGISGERWGLAEELLRNRSLEEWSDARLGSGWTFTQEERGLRGVRKSLFRSAHALVQKRQDQNQITMIRVHTRKQMWRPEWDWLI